MSTGVTNEEEPLESVTGGGEGDGDDSLSLSSSLRSFHPVYFFFPSSPTWIVEGWLAKVGPAKHKLGILKFPVGKKLFFSFHFFSFSLSLSLDPSRSAYHFCPSSTILLEKFLRLIFKQVREDFERSFELDLL